MLLFYIMEAMIYMTVKTLEKKLKPFEEPVENALLKWLYIHLPPQPIANKRMHAAYSKAVSILLREQEIGKLDQTSQTAIAKYLNAVVPFVEEYEKKEFPIGSSTPEEMLRFIMEQHGLSQYNVADDLGGQSVVSNILRDKRKLTHEHIERLSKRFHITPRNFLRHCLNQNSLLNRKNVSTFNLFDSPRKLGKIRVFPTPKISYR